MELRETDHTAVVTVQERQLSLAIGKDGQNARLAAKLTGWRVDVTKPAEGEVFEERMDEFHEPAISHAARRDRGDRRHDRSERGEGGSRRSNQQRGGGRRHSYDYGDERD